VKQALKTVITDRLLTDETLTTFLCEVESMVNSRLLTPISDDPNDLESITSNHFVMNKTNDNTPLGRFGDKDLDSRRKWRKLQSCDEHALRKVHERILVYVNGKIEMVQRRFDLGI